MKVGVGDGASRWTAALELSEELPTSRPMAAIPTTTATTTAATISTTPVLAPEDRGGLGDEGRWDDMGTA